jgi:Fe-S-cluster containining protein
MRNSKYGGGNLVMSDDCTCERCVGSCWHSPGWFGSIEEVEAAARLLNMSVKDFRKEYLIQEWFYTDEDYDNVAYVPAPRKDFSRDKRKEMINGTVYGMRFIIESFEEDARRNGKGFVRATWGHNLITEVACIFLTKDEKCRIHEAKPYECRVTYSCRESNHSREEVYAYWKEHQDWFEEVAPWE